MPQSNRQRNPALASQPSHSKLSTLEDTIRQATRSRSPTNLSPICKPRSRRRSSGSTTSHATELSRRRSRSRPRLDTSFSDQSMRTQTQTSPAFSPLDSQQQPSPFPQFSLGEPVFPDNESPSQCQSPVAQPPSGDNLNWQFTAQPLQRAQSSKVKDGQMIRITLKTPTTEVPCIAKCYLNRALSVVDNEFARSWNIKIHPVPKPRWKDARHWCVLDAINVETIGDVQQQLRIRLGKLPDRRFSIELGVDALKALRLVDEIEAVSPLSRSAPPSQYPSWPNISSSHMPQPQQPQDSIFGYGLTLPTQPPFPAGRNRAVTVPTIPLIRIDTTFDNTLSVPMSLGDSGSGEDSSSPWETMSLNSQSYQDENGNVWSPAISECGISSSYDTCMK
ncbi:unnamed protein product [Fusarium equiseti]|uniref:3-ketoacyl-peroxisomal n=1 Tax=Fusarium equiseti TaxID=61235 RepID=A0A8J2NNM9_FUSEQ|nr:unnamed protein product [Fusarium equiseti]